MRLACHDWNWFPYMRQLEREVDLEVIFEDMKSAGFDAVEFSGMPAEMDDPGRTASLLRRFGFTLAGMTVCHMHEENVAEVLCKQVRFLAEMGAKMAVLMVKSETRKPRAELTEDDYRTVGRMSTELFEYAASLGVDVTVHNHRGMMVETLAELDRFRHYCPACGFCIDTGHLIAVGEDPAEAVRRYAPILRHVHLKDAAFKDDGTFDDFVELGAGNSRFAMADVVSALREVAYDGWVVLEQDRTKTTPVDSAKKSLAFLEAHGF